MQVTIMLKTLLPAIAMLSPALAMAQPPANRADMIARMGQADANRDGSVTRPELIEWRKANFTRFDRNRDGAISEADIPTFLRGSSIGAQFDQMRTQFDANRDGRITRDEFVSAPTLAFDLADTNHDNIVTLAEIDAAVALAKAAKGR
jgi:Ca2+-binding EF-hand superfamily protein